MNENQSASAPAGPADQRWLDQISPWLDPESLPAVTILPERIMNDTAVFGADTAPWVKMLKADGFDISFLPTPEQTFKSEYGTFTDITLNIALNLAASGMWDGFKAIWQLIRLRIQASPKAAEEQQITLTQVIYRSPDGSSMLCQQFSGSCDQVMEQSHAALQMYLPEFPGSAPEPEDTPDEPPSATAE
jgi:hypothetical protein